jgi:hypothetical protein
MSVSLIVTRGIDQNFQPTDRSIDLAEWTKLVEDEPSLKMRAAPAAAVNPTTGETIAIRLGPADSQLQIGEEWVPFLRYRAGELVITFTDELLNPENAVRRKIASIAAQLNAVITHDAGDEIFQW